MKGDMLNGEAAAADGPNVDAAAAARETSFNVVVGDDIGQVKVVDFKKEGQAQASAQAEGRKWGEPKVQRLECGGSGGVDGTASKRSGAVVSVCALGDGEEAGSAYVVGRRSGQVDLLNASEGTSTSLILCDSKEGRAKSDDGSPWDLLAVRRIESGLLTCTTRGIVESWDWKREEGPDSRPLPLTEASMRLETVKSSGPGGLGHPVEAFEVSGDGRIGTGGRENNLKVWDLETGTSVFLARSPKSNELGIWDKPWITCMMFLPVSGETSANGGGSLSSDVVLCGTANHQLRLYDARVKRRPVAELEWGENKITSLCLDTPGVAEKIWCANATGQIHLLDLKMANGFSMAMSTSLKGSLGCVRALTRHPTKPLAFSCGLDRYLRVYDLRKARQISSVYLKQYLTALAVVPEAEKETDSGEEGEGGPIGEEGAAPKARERRDDDEDEGAERERPRKKKKSRKY